MPSSTVGIADKAARLKLQGHKVIDLSAGRASEHTPEYICQAATNAIRSGDTHQTMARGKVEFRKACAIKLSRDNGITADPDSEIIATMGVKQGLTLALLATINPGDEVIIEDPCFVSYYPLITVAGGKGVPVPLKPENNFRWTQEQLLGAISEKTRAILFNSPHNPTGTVHSPEDLEMIARVAIENDLFVITDEVYEHVTWDGHQHTCLAGLPGMKERTISAMGLTKTFSMGGWRIGFAFAPERILKEMVKLQQHLLTCAGSFTQTGAAAAFENPPLPEVIKLWEKWDWRITMFIDGLNKIPGLKCKKPEGGFYGWVDISETGMTSQQMTDKLLDEAKVTVVPGASFGENGEGYIRVTCVKSREDLMEALSRIEDVLN